MDILNNSAVWVHQSSIHKRKIALLKKKPTVLFLIKKLLALFLQGTVMIPQAIFLQVIIVMPTSYFSGYFKLVDGVWFSAILFRSDTSYFIT